MATEQERVVKLETQHDELQRRITQLESNQRWGVMAILGLVFKSIMDLVGMQT